MQARQWLGTILLADEAILYWSRVSDGLCSRVSQMKQGLFEWIHPGAPEDLCFCRDNSEPILVTTSQENDSYLLLTEAEIALLQKDYPMLWEVLEKEGS